MKIKIFFSLMLALVCSYCMGQGVLKTFTVCNSADTIKKVVQGDTVIIACNSAYILNQNVLDNYRKALQNNRNYSEAIQTYAALNNTQDSMIEDQARRFNELKDKFDSLGNNTGQFLTITQGSLNQLNDTLAAVAVNINATKQLLFDTQKLLEAEKENKWKDRLRWGIGGFTVGLVATTVVYLLVK
jgi:hypothetical protein